MVVTSKVYELAKGRWNEIGRKLVQDEPGRTFPTFDEVGYQPEIEEGK